MTLILQLISNNLLLMALVRLQMIHQFLMYVPPVLELAFKIDLTFVNLSFTNLTRIFVWKTVSKRASWRMSNEYPPMFKK